MRNENIEMIFFIIVDKSTLYPGDVFERHVSNHLQLDCCFNNVFHAYYNENSIIPHYSTFVMGTHLWPEDSPQKGK